MLLVIALAKIDKPALIIVEAQGPCGSICQDMQKHILGSRMEVPENVGHALLADEPERFNSLLENFIGSLAHRPIAPCAFAPCPLTGLSSILLPLNLKQLKEDRCSRGSDTVLSHLTFRRKGFSWI